MTVAQLAEELATELGEAYADPDVSRQFDSFVLEAVEELFGEADWVFLHGEATVTTSNGDRAYTLGATVGAPTSVTDDETGTLLTGRTREALVREGVDLTDTSMIPTHWYLDGVDAASGQISLGFWPVPTGARDYTVRFLQVSALDDASDSLILPPDVRRALRHLVREQYYENSGEPQAADRARARYTRAVVSLRKRYELAPGVETKVRFGDIERSRRTPYPRFPQTIS